MGDYSTSRIDDLPQLWDGFGKLVRKGLGIEAFGANIMDVPADYTTGPHDESGQRAGGAVRRAARRRAGCCSARTTTARRRSTLDPETMVRVGPGERRRLRAGAEGCRVLIVGGTPGQAYTPPEWSS